MNVQEPSPVTGSSGSGVIAWLSKTWLGKTIRKIKFLMTRELKIDELRKFILDFPEENEWGKVALVKCHIKQIIPKKEINTLEEIKEARTAIKTIRDAYGDTEYCRLVEKEYPEVIDFLTKQLTSALEKDPDKSVGIIQRFTTDYGFALVDIVHTNYLKLKNLSTREPVSLGFSDGASIKDLEKGEGFKNTLVKSTATDFEKLLALRALIELDIYPDVIAKWMRDKPFKLKDPLMNDIYSGVFGRSQLETLQKNLYEHMSNFAETLKGTSEEQSEQFWQHYNEIEDLICLLILIDNWRVDSWRDEVEKIL